MNSEQIAQARVLARLLSVAEQREVVDGLLDEIERLRTERDRLREDLALAIHTISHQLDNIPKEMRRIAADRIAQFRETLGRTALEQSND